jgi:hypothetical protein
MHAVVVLVDSEKGGQQGCNTQLVCYVTEKLCNVHYSRPRVTISYKIMREPQLVVSAIIPVSISQNRNKRKMGVQVDMKNTVAHEFLQMYHFA